MAGKGEYVLEMDKINELTSMLSKGVLTKVFKSSRMVVMDVSNLSFNPGERVIMIPIHEKGGVWLLVRVQNKDYTQKTR